MNGIKKRISVLLAVIVLCSVASPAFAAEAFFTAPISTAKTDGDGYNQVGNLTEQIGFGGSYCIQKDWGFYADTENGNRLTAANADNSISFVLTDFAVANINVLGDLLLFTDRSGSVARGYAADANLEFVNPMYGGKLYSIKGILGLYSSTPKKPGAPTPLASQDRMFYRVCGVGDGMFALSSKSDDASVGQSLELVHLSFDGALTVMMSSTPEEQLVDMIPSLPTIYVETDKGDSWGEVVIVDSLNKLITGAFPGRDIRTFGDRLFFISNTDYYLYEIALGATSPRVISACDIAAYTLLDNGDLSACTGSGKNTLLLSLNGDYRCSTPPVKVGDWYNYLSNKMPRPTENPETPSYTAADAPSSDYTWDPPGGSPGSDISGSRPPNTTPGGPPEPTPSSKPIQLPPMSEKVSPQQVVEMLVHLTINGGTLSDGIFDVYDAAAKQKFSDFYGLSEITSGFGSIRQYLVEGLRAGAMTGASEFGVDFSEKTEELLANSFMELVRQAEYSYLPTRIDENHSVVPVASKSYLDVTAIETVQVSDNEMQGYLLQYMMNNGISAQELLGYSDEEKMGLALLAFFDGVKQQMNLIAYEDRLIELNLEADETLGWVLTDDGAKFGSIFLNTGAGGGSGSSGNGEQNSGNGEQKPDNPPQPTKEEETPIKERPEAMKCNQYRFAMMETDPGFWRGLWEKAKSTWNDMTGESFYKFQLYSQYKNYIVQLGGYNDGAPACEMQGSSFVWLEKPKSNAQIFHKMIRDAL